MYHILVVSALSQELSVVRKKIKKFNIPSLKIDFLQTGMGNYNTIFGLTKKLEQKKYDFVVNIGVSGIRNWDGFIDGIGIDNNDFNGGGTNSDGGNEQMVEDILSSGKTNLPKISQSPFYQASNIFELETGKELIVPVFLKFGPLASCISANKPIKNKDLYGFVDRIRVDNNKNQDGFVDRIGMNNNFDGCKYNIKGGKEKTLLNYSELSSELYLLDMESYGFEFVLEKYNLPRIILKVPIDKTDDELKNFDYNEALELLGDSVDYEKLLVEIKKYLDSLSKNNLNLDVYFSQLPFSQRQKEIFEFLYRKYTIIISKDFNAFFKKILKKNKNNKNKKEVVKILISELGKLFEQEDL